MKYCGKCGKKASWCLCWWFKITKGTIGTSK